MLLSNKLITKELIRLHGFLIYVYTRQMPVSKHIDNCCKTQRKFSLFPFYKFQTDDVSARLAKERYFIDVFSPKLNMF